MFELRPYQKPIADKVFTYMRKNKGKHPLVAMPTGSGKTVVLADVIHKAISKWPSTKVLVLSHAKEILQQDYDALTFHLPNANIGLHSAGLGARDVSQITICGIQSVYKKGELFADYNLIIIDECHLIPNSEDSMYQTFFASLNNPRYLGLTATPFRLGTGYIYGKDALFDDLIYDLTSFFKFAKLIDNGYLCKLRTQATTNELDTKGIHTIGGDFDKNEMSLAFNKDAITKAAIQEIIKLGANYKKWLIFAIDIEHAESIADELIANSIPTLMVHSKMNLDRDWIIKEYKAGNYRAMVNVNVLTTGFDDPEIDLIVLLRPTKSPVIHVQTIGRGLRQAPGKDHCLVLDFAGNTERLGPINAIHVKKKAKVKDGDGEPITKRCPKCDAIHHPSAKVCDSCGHKFVFKTELRTQSTATDVVLTKASIWHNVTGIEYRIHRKRNSPDSLRVTYLCGLIAFNEFICLDHSGYAAHWAKNWANFRGVEARNVVDLLGQSKNLTVPKRILVDKSKRYARITDYVF